MKLPRELTRMDIPTQLQAVPRQPGVYLFKDARDKVLYVGKAKALRNRVRSYFQPAAQLDASKAEMVSKVKRIETVACDSEHEALVLEANLIQTHRPPYNIILTDDKYYLFIKITKETLPRVLLVRRIKTDGARYFGPYSSAHAARRTVRLLRRLFPVRGDKIQGDWIFPHPLFGQSAPPVAGSGQSLNDAAVHTYQENIENIIRFLNGDRAAITTRLRRGMRAAAHRRQYERAALFRDQLQALEQLDLRQKVLLPRAESFDVVSIAQQPIISAANIFTVRRGKLIGKNTFILRHRGTAPLTDTVRQFILQYYRLTPQLPKTIYLPAPLEDSRLIARWISPGQPVEFRVPQRGIKRALLAMGTKNAALALRQEQLAFSSQRRRHALEELARSLGLDTAPRRIETYDISTIQGALSTGSMAVATDGQPQPRHYRKFRIHREGPPNDVAMIQEVLRRRLGHPEWPTPDLMVIDGGKGQLSAAVSVLTAAEQPIPVIALAKREEEIFTVGRKESLRLPFNSDALRLLQQLRDEAHRFTLSYHQLLRSKHQHRSLLDEVPGIGPTTKRKLLRHFGSLRAIRAASTTQLAAVIGTAKAKAVQDYL